MRIQKAIFLFFFSFLSSFANADLFVNLLDSPNRSGATKANVGMLISSSVDLETDSGRDVGDIERQSVVISGVYGMSSNSGIYGGIAHIIDGEWNDDDVEGNSYFGGAYGEVDIIQGTKVLAYGQYKSFDEEDDRGGDLEGSEFTVGLVGVFKQPSGISYYFGPEYVVSSDIDQENGLTNDFEREKKFGLHAGFNYPMSGSDMSFYGIAGFMNEQSFFLGVSKDLK